MEASGRIVHRLAAAISRDASPRSRRRLSEPCLAQPVRVVIGIRGALKGIHGEQPADTGDFLWEHAARELATMVTVDGVAMRGAFLKASQVGARCGDEGRCVAQR